MLEPVEFAPDWIKKIAPNAKFIALFRVYSNANITTYPSLRDRTKEYTAALKGLVNDLDADVWEIGELTGGEWSNRFGMEVYGADYINKFKLLVAF